MSHRIAAHELTPSAIARTAAVAGTPDASTRAPAASADHTEVWTGSGMLVWGGEGADGGLVLVDTGGRYTP